MRRLTFHHTLLLICGLLVLTTANAQFWGKKEPKLLPEEDAFQVYARINGDQLLVNWIIAPDYYMYRDQFGVKSANAEFAAFLFPPGETEIDPLFGEVTVYFETVDLSAAVTTLPTSGDTIELTLLGQGCNKPVGVCYPPQTRSVTVAFDPSTSGTSEQTPPQSAAAASLSASSGFSDARAEKSFWGYVLAAFGAGILLSFTPCVLPMIPILLGVIAGQKSPSKLRAGWLAACYVAGTVVVYAVAGWVAGLSGTQLQAYFQHPWVIAGICALLVLLAASLFGAFKIQLPSSLQTRLSGKQVNLRSASLTSFTLGTISSLVVGACVSPILILTLGAAISKGDPVLGSAIMSAMALGMGLLLILVGFGAGWILPKSGAWMQQVQIIFGFMVLGAAIYIASFVDAVPALYLWGALLLWAGYYIYSLGQSTLTPLIRSVWGAIAAVLIIWGGMSIVGGATGGSDVLRPLSTFSAGSSAATQTKIPFSTVTTLPAAKRLLDDAKANGQLTLIDFYADWCIDCKRMARTTFTEPEVHRALDGWQLIEIDVTETNSESEELKRYFDVFGPPATLFLNADGTENTDLRQYGFLNKTDFLALVNRNSKL